jgi:general secretion pathway protein B
MSTILRALQKQNGVFTEAKYSSIANNSPSKLLIISIITCLFIIAVLTGLLIQKQTKEKPLQENKIEKITTVTKAPMKPITKNEKQITKIVFHTKAMPLPKTVKPSHPKKTKQAEVRIVNQKVTVTETPIRLAKTETTPKKPISKDELKVEDLSQKLREKFALAIAETDNEIANDQPLENDGLTSADGQDIHDMASGFQQKVPELRYDSHVYSSKAKDRWIKINGRKLYEGSEDKSTHIEVLAIEPYKTIFRLGSQSFSLEALVDWKG